MKKSIFNVQTDIWKILYFIVQTVPNYFIKSWAKTDIIIEILMSTDITEMISLWMRISVCQKFTEYKMRLKINHNRIKPIIFEIYHIFLDIFTINFLRSGRKWSITRTVSKFLNFTYLSCLLFFPVRILVFFISLVRE